MYNFGAFAAKAASHLRKNVAPALAQVAFDSVRHHHFDTAPQQNYHWPKPSYQQPFLPEWRINQAAYMNATQYQHPSHLSSKTAASVPCWGLPHEIVDTRPITTTERNLQHKSQSHMRSTRHSLGARILSMCTAYCDGMEYSSQSLFLDDSLVFGFEKKDIFIEPSFIPSLASHIQHHCGVQVLIEKPKEILAPYISVSSPHSALVQINLEPLSTAHANYHEAVKMQKDMTLITLSALPEPVIIEIEMRFQNQHDATELLKLLREIAVSRDNIELKFKKCGVCQDRAIDRLMDELSGVGHHVNIAFLDKIIDDLESNEKRPRRKLGAL